MNDIRRCWQSGNRLRNEWQESTSKLKGDVMASRYLEILRNNISHEQITKHKKKDEGELWRHERIE